MGLVLIRPVLIITNKDMKIIRRFCHTQQSRLSGELGVWCGFGIVTPRHAEERSSESNSGQLGNNHCFAM